MAFVFVDILFSTLTQKPIHSLQIATLIQEQCVMRRDILILNLYYRWNILLLVSKCYRQIFLQLMIFILSCDLLLDKI